jgi:pyrroloquinoline-quinone synthase
MTTENFISRLDVCIHKYDLLCHPFYKAWSAGELTRDDLRAYAEAYYHHVNAFPSYLAEFGIRLEESDLRRAVFANMNDEKGGEDSDGSASPSHADLWLDFVAGMGGSRTAQPSGIPEIQNLISHFHRMAAEGTPEEALASFYAYESQVPRVASEKDRGLREMYCADEKTRAYFTLHATADIYHSQVWRKQLEKCVATDPETCDKALASAEATAKALWNALDGIEAQRLARNAA